jgi:NADPH:quinone reductase-like Zn-dependent oxidoreductase
MKALAFKEFGGPDKLAYQDVPDPKIKPNEVLVRVRACALNHLDLFVREGIPALKTPLPFWTGCDIAGEVAEVGAGVTGVKVGERVAVNPNLTCGRCEFCMQGEDSLCLRYGILGEHAPGGLAELVPVRGENVLPLPAHVSFEDAASFVLTNMTAWRMVVTQAQVRPGQDVLVIGVGGGVSSTAVQIARLCGARVIATVGSDDKIEFARGLGAEQVVNYRTQDFVEETKKWTNKRGVDVVVEHIGGETFERSAYALTRLGTLVSIGSHDTHWGRLDLRHVYSKNLRIVGTNLGSIVELGALLDAVIDGRLRPVIDRAFPLADARAAVQHVLDRKNKGKVLLVP